ncbi:MULTISPECIES: sugar transferase [Corynebacterium]|uniref:sugar transferase n=1 Tax=Corynebacterium TaxID=1716 RepID=UPI00069777B6|nr:MULTISPECIES: sugar transferase [Corynebacterium]MCF6785243.1 sugar transferase [Corynebacterium parakroppenstedtii]MCF6791576.1 sugar transferase [Corynebacterium parakroppenstedtii]MCF6817705.1 sugar transferase [Corynebacterium parakroppenstedtii]MCZ9301907.1 sugar transferase [Corynebacterium sp. c24U_166]
MSLLHITGLRLAERPTRNRERHTDEHSSSAAVQHPTSPELHDANRHDIPASSTDALIETTTPPERTSIRCAHASRIRTFILVSEAIAIVSLIVAADYLPITARSARTFTLGSYTGTAPMFVPGTILFALWVMVMRIMRTTDSAILGQGALEYSRIARATTFAFGLFAIVCELTQYTSGFRFLVFTYPVDLVTLLLIRYGWRRFYCWQLDNKRLSQRAIFIGDPHSISEVYGTLRRQLDTKFDIVGFCSTQADAHSEEQLAELKRRFPEAEIHDNWHQIDVMVSLLQADSVIVTVSNQIGMDDMRELMWRLDGLNVELLVAPTVANVTGRRVQMLLIAGVPLLKLERPQHARTHCVSKIVFDRVVAALLLLMASPLLLVCAVAIKLDDGGPVFYTAERMGKKNKPFGMIKFRSMVQNTDQMVAQLKDQSDGNDVLFKMKNDPRVTRVGSFLRRYSIDELPQLFNVLKGDMSLVGPRPPLRREVEQYTGLVGNRMLVLPGMTGLWQVSGRSNLSWEESVSLDLNYVENWSFMADLMILWKTGRAVLTSDGAY